MSIDPAALENILSPLPGGALTSQRGETIIGLDASRLKQSLSG